MEEKFYPIKEYEDFYEISRNGVVRSFDRVVNYKYPNTFCVKKGKIMKNKLNSDGYYSIMLCDGNKIRKTYLIHRLVAINFISNSENKPQVNHINNIKTDNNVNNLKWGTTLSNSREAALDGLYKSEKGSKKHNSKLFESQVLFIRRLYKDSDILQKELAIMFGVCKQVINCIIQNKIWKHI
jgi:hypothetical protein